MKQRSEMAVICLLAATSLITACGNIQTRFSKAEEKLETDGDTGMLFHAALYYPKEVNLKFDGYLIGIEKANREKISTPADLAFAEVNDVGASASNLFNDRRLLYISHILRNNEEPNRNNNCFVYNAYDQKKVLEKKQFAVNCNGDKEILDPSHAFSNSWHALKMLEDSVSERVKNNNYTHIVVITMGWNTIQEEAVFNFNSIVSNLKTASSGKNTKFNPLVIGVTWPSQWETPFLPSALVRFASFPVKAKDADELGMSWLGALLHQTIPAATTRAAKELPLVVIGHSFGARASSAAACVGPLIQNGDKHISRKRIPVLINLQGAFRTDRLFGISDLLSKITYPAGCQNVGALVLTSSTYDEAVKTHFWGTPYAGTRESYKKYCVDSIYDEIQCVDAKEDGTIQNLHLSKRIIYVNANKLITENAYKTGGGAHSDIYREEHGELLRQFLPQPTGTAAQRAGDIPDKFANN